MTIEMQREQQQQDQRAAAANRAHAAQQRDAAAAVNTAVAAARVERTRARHLGANKRRLADAFEILSSQINGCEEMTVLEPGNVLRHGLGTPEAGTANIAAVCEFVARIMDGQLPNDAIEDMHETRLERHLAAAVRHADAVYQRAYALENAAVLQPALPAAAVSNGAPLVKRAPSGSASLVEPAPPESPTQSTGQIALHAIEAMLAEGHEMPASQAALTALNGHNTAGFGVASVPGPRAGDTVRMDLRELVGDGPVEETEDDDVEAGRLVPPFPGAGIADPGEASSAGGASDDES